MELFFRVKVFFVLSDAGSVYLKEVILVFVVFTEGLFPMKGDGVTFFDGGGVALIEEYDVMIIFLAGVFVLSPTG